jgi:hypothetical protein
MEQALQTAQAHIERVHPPGGEGSFAIVAKTDGGFQHRYFSAPHAAAQYAIEAAAAGQDVYVSTATFSRESRRAECALQVCGLYADIDCGPGKPYATKQEAGRAAVRTCVELNLPQPDLWIDSGHGLHLYWLSESGIPAAGWKPPVEAFKATLLNAGLQIDPTVTADAARILRVAGTRNYKGGKESGVEVRLLKDRQTCSAGNILDVMRASAPSKTGLPSHLIGDAATAATNSDLMHRDPPPAETPENVARLKSALSVLDADCSYERWRAIVWSIKAHNWGCGKNIAQEWSSTAAARYDPAAFEKLWESSR